MAKIRKPKARRTPYEVREKVSELLARGMSPPEIHRALDQDPELGPLLPTLRTIQSLVKELLPSDPSGPWALADANDPDDARLVLDVIPHLLERTERRVQSVTRARASWVVRIRRAAPDLRPWSAYLLALEYQRCEASGGGTSHLDTYLAFAPWRDDAHAARYNAVVGRGQEGETVYNALAGRPFVQAVPEALHLRIELDVLGRQAESLKEGSDGTR